MSWQPPGRVAPVDAAPAERRIWRVEKDTRWAEARLRAVPHGDELRFVVSRGPGAEPELMWSAVYKAGEGAKMGQSSTGVLQDFQHHGWMVVDDTPEDERQ